MRRLLILATGALVAILQPVLVPSADAARPCPSSYHPSNYGMGSHYLNSVFGARGRIEFRAPDLCGNDASGPGLSTVWAMVTAPPVDSEGTDGWAQAGYIKLGDATAFDSSGTRFFFQNTKKCKAHISCPAGEKPYVTKFFGPPSGTAYYSTYLRSSDDRIHMAAAGVDLGSVGYDVTGQWKSTWSAQYGAETYHFEDDVPGTGSKLTHFDFLQQYASNGDLNFIPSFGTSDPQTTRYHRASYGRPVAEKDYLYGQIHCDPAPQVQTGCADACSRHGRLGRCGNDGRRPQYRRAIGCSKSRNRRASGG